MARQQASDSDVLNMIQLRKQGHSSADIGRMLGVSREFVATATNRVLTADIKHSGEPEQDVRAERRSVFCSCFICSMFVLEVLHLVRVRVRARHLAPNVFETFPWSVFVFVLAFES